MHGGQFEFISIDRQEDRLILVSDSIESIDLAIEHGKKDKRDPAGLL